MIDLQAASRNGEKNRKHWVTMVRQRKEDAEVTRWRILESARACFLNFGFSNTSMEMIALHAGNTRGAIYWHFQSKEHILSALMDLELATRSESLCWEFAKTSNEPLRILSDEIVNSLRELASNIRLLGMFEILLRASRSANIDAIHLLAQRGALVQLHTLKSILHRANELGQLLKRTNIDNAARSLYTGIAGVVYGKILDPDEFDLERDGSQVVEGFLILHAPLYALPAARPKHGILLLEE